jgi:hypothetical protein
MMFSIELLAVSDHLLDRRCLLTCIILIPMCVVREGMALASKESLHWKMLEHTRVYTKVPGLAAWSENCKLYSSLPLGSIVSLFCESV